MGPAPEQVNLGGKPMHHGYRTKIREILQNAYFVIPKPEAFQEGNAVKPPKTMKRRFSALWIAILALFAAPIALPLALGILAVIGAVILGILAVVGGILISALAAIAGSVLGIIGGIAIIPQTFGGGLVTIGLSLMLIGCGILVTYFTILLARWTIIKLAGLLGRLVKKGGRRHEEK